MGLEVGGLIGLLVLIADIWAILNVFASQASLGAKLVWIVLILILPVLGLLIWLMAGPRAARAA
ncbi:MAG: PLDc N-terminal domain-containing protein [Geminicoccaceae bacterium]